MTCEPLEELRNPPEKWVGVSVSLIVTRCHQADNHFHILWGSHDGAVAVRSGLPSHRSHRQHRTRGVTNDVFGYAAQQGVPQSGEAIGRQHDEIAAKPLGRAHLSHDLWEAILGRRAYLLLLRVQMAPDITGVA
jgi:hypothetical protein